MYQIKNSSAWHAPRPWHFAFNTCPAHPITSPIILPWWR